MYWEVIDSVIKEIRYQVLTEGRTIGTKFAKIIRNKRPYIRISVPLFQHRLKCKLKKTIRFVYQDFQLSAGMSSFLRYVLAAL